MERKEAKEQAFKERLNESSNGLLCSELKKLTGKTMTILNDKDLNPGDFVYDGIIIHSWFCNYGVNSDNEKPDTPDIAVPIYTFAKVPELKKVAEVLHKEKGINVITDNVLPISNACRLAGVKDMDIIGELKTLGLRDWDKMKEIIDEVLKGMNKILNPEFEIHMNILTHEIYIRPNGNSGEEIIGQTKLFKNKIKEIVDFFENDATIKNKIKSAVSEQKTEREADNVKKDEVSDLLRNLL